jgi:hypothetical protein
MRSVDWRTARARRQISVKAPRACFPSWISGGGFRGRQDSAHQWLILRGSQAYPRDVRSCRVSSGRTRQFTGSQGIACSFANPMPKTSQAIVKPLSDGEVPALRYLSVPVDFWKFGSPVSRAWRYGFRWVSLKRVGYFNPYPSIRSKPM